MSVVPRVLLHLSNEEAADIAAEALSNHTDWSIGVILSVAGLSPASHLEVAYKVKQTCLNYACPLILDDLELAAKVNADGVHYNVDDTFQGHARDVLGPDKIIGGTAHDIGQVADLFEEGMTDFIILESFFEGPNATNLLGRQKTQQILDDSRIMGYNLPILISGGINTGNAEHALLPGLYGMVTSDISALGPLYDLIRQRPLQ